jgi:hypothetical protein
MESKSVPLSFDIARRYAKHREQDYLGYGERAGKDKKRKRLNVARKQSKLRRKLKLYDRLTNTTYQRNRNRIS